ncbi:hypothetical protein GCM10011415_13300 [Salipiger pallidus]|uniref:OmpR/PhoB-type domain-containing protein n=1 Tax=Salipiger pallidus TaxID=1775170 RepID=A0A8J2ZIA0_9RHOB|nr:winged helix-turn-helix domain-containing protein [Salipiger pallidus]GGG67586.1 hypothetical protein GCM10011415_13300 [Salipiger pallidus]
MPKVLRRERPSELRGLLTDSAPLEAMIVGLSRRQMPDEPQLGLVALARRLCPGAVIIAVDHSGRSRAAVEAFAAGADDVLGPGHDPAELRARLALRLQRHSSSERRGARLARLGLTPIEEQIYRHLSDHMGEVVDRADLAHVIGMQDWSYGDRRFDVHIARIRQKLEDRSDGELVVRSIRGRGYVLERHRQGHPRQTT